MCICGPHVPAPCLSRTGLRLKDQNGVPQQVHVRHERARDRQKKSERQTDKEDRESHLEVCAKRGRIGRAKTLVGAPRGHSWCIGGGASEMLQAVAITTRAKNACHYMSYLCCSSCCVSGCGGCVCTNPWRTQPKDRPRCCGRMALHPPATVSPTTKHTDHTHGHARARRVCGTQVEVG